MSSLVSEPLVRLYAVVYVLLGLKMAAVGNYTSILRLRRKIFATPEDYALQGMAPRTTRDEDIERTRRAHQNDVENIPLFWALGFVFLMTYPPLVAAEIYLVGFLLARTAHSIFYIRSMQPHRTIAFALGGVLTLAMAVHTLIAVLRS